MKLLLDTCTFLWLITDAADLSARARSLFRDPANRVFFSSVSAWEIAVKCDLGKLFLPDSAEQFVPAQRKRHAIESLPLEEEAALMLPKLPHYHRDPFDRMLICQANYHGMTVLTPDSQITRYPVRCIW
jgi:PIN domain nuclease of toxin-antitoxin system